MTGRVVLTLVWTVCLLAVPMAGWSQSVDELDAEGAEYLKLARAAMRSTDFDQAWQLLERAQAHFEQRGDTAGRIHAAIVTADYHMHTAGGPLIFEAIDHALALARRHELSALEAHALKQSSQYLADAGQFDKARQRLAAAESIYRELDDERRLLDVRVFASLLASRAGNDRRAALLAAEVVPAAEAAGRGNMAVHALSILGYSEQRLGRHEQALATYQRLIPRAWAAGDRLQLNHAYCTVAEIKRELGMADEAEADLARMIESLEASRHTLLSSPGRRSAYLERQIEGYSRLAALLVDDHRPVEALELVDRFKSMAFFDHLAQVEIHRLADAEQGWRKHERELLSALARSAEASARTAPEAGRRGATTADQGGDELSVLAARLETLRAEYWHQQRLPGPPVRPEPLPLAEVQQSLADSEALIVYWLLDERLLAWVVTARRADFTNIPVKREELAAAVANYTAPMRWPWLARDHALTGRETAHIDTGGRLYRWLIESLPPVAFEHPDWLIVADDLLHELPFGALIRSCPATPAPDNPPVHWRYADCSYLIDRHTLRQAVSPSGVAYQRQLGAGRGDRPGDSILVLAPEFGSDSKSSLPALPHAAREAAQIAKYFSHASVLTGAAATRSQFLQHAKGHDAIHLATHGLLDEAHPLSSGVALASDTGPGLLTAADVLSVGLETDLVSLASCRTGSGPISRAEGRQGLARAFVHAGARQVLVSQWDLRDDHAAVILPAFYRARQQGMHAHQALRGVQMDYRQRIEAMTLVVNPAETALAHPRFWAGFQLIGTP